jgi:hypothetical protein
MLARARVPQADCEEAGEDTGPRKLDMGRRQKQIELLSVRLSIDAMTNRWPVRYSSVKALAFSSLILARAGSLRTV